MGPSSMHNTMQYYVTYNIWFTLVYVQCAALCSVAQSVAGLATVFSFFVRLEPGFMHCLSIDLFKWNIGFAVLPVQFACKFHCIVSIHYFPFQKKHTSNVVWFRTTSR